MNLRRPEDLVPPEAELAVADPCSTVTPTVTRTGRRRRPTGAPPPLPRHIGRSGRLWVIALGALTAWTLVAFVFDEARRLTDQADAAVLRAFAAVRTGWLTDVARAIDRVATGWVMTVIALGLLIATVAFKRWRHLFTYLASVIAMEILGLLLIAAFRRPRPYDVTTIGRWRGYSLPSATAAIVTFTVVGIIYMLVVPGRPRSIAKIVGAAAVAAVVLARMYLGVDHPFDVITGVTIGVAIPLVAFRIFTPNEVAPVNYHGGKTAHLDIGGQRGEAIRQAMNDQLGVTVVDIRPIGLAGSGGSTPLRLRLAGDPDTFVFGKLYAMNHVRSDRWYKSGRTILYGRLEDEAPFQTVGRLVQYEDYALRVMRDAGIPTAAPLGIVALTPEREYLLVTEFFDGAVEIDEAEVDDRIIDAGLSLVRRLWNAGLAHRDIKPANLMVRDGELFLIDVAFAQVRPSPWREAIDLANMMLVLAVRTDAERVYRRALDHFTADEIAEAFAAARGIASPTQLRSVLKQDGRDLVAEFRALAPYRRPISLQRWGPRRVVMALGVVALVLLGATNVYAMFTPAELPIGDDPTCASTDLLVLMAQAVPAATAVPCLAAIPSGWSVDGVRVRNGDARFWLDSDRAGDDAVEVRLVPASRCDVAAASAVASEEPGWQRFDQRLADGGRRRLYIEGGGCVVVRLNHADQLDGATLADLDRALGFEPRVTLAADVERRTGLTLCGAGAPPCAGSEG